jgi:hypothetical protein
MAARDLHRHARRQMFFQVPRGEIQDVVPVLVRHHAEGDLGHRVAGDDRFRSHALVTTADAVDLRGGPPPNSLKRAVTLFAEKRGRPRFIEDLFVAIEG